MKFSYTTLLDYPLADSLEHIKTADELGYYACYAADETWHKDLWLLYAAAADKTKNVRFGPNLSSVYLREPTLICQALATLDELTGGRAEGVISCGNFGMLVAVRRRLEDDQAVLPGQGGARGHAHLPRRRRDHVRGPVPHVQRALHLRAAGAGAPAPLHRRHARPQVDAARRRGLRRRPQRAGLQQGLVRLRRRERQDRRRERRPRLDDARHRRLVRRHLRARLGEGEDRGAGHRHLLPLLPAGRAVRGARHRPGRDEGDRRGARQRATSRRRTR